MRRGKFAASKKPCFSEFGEKNIPWSDEIAAFCSLRPRGGEGKMCRFTTGFPHTKSGKPRFYRGFKGFKGKELPFVSERTPHRPAPERALDPLGLGGICKGPLKNLQECKTCFSCGDSHGRARKKGARFTAHSPHRRSSKNASHHVIYQISKSVRVSEHGATGDVAISLWELLDANHQRVEGIGAIGASLQLVLFGLCQLFASLILLAIVDTSESDG